MGFLKNLFGGTFDSNKADGDALYKEKTWGEARLAYERALKKGDDASEDDRNGVRLKITECKLELARVRIAEADELAEVGEIEEARALLEDATDICNAQEILDTISERRVDYEAAEARHLASEEGEMTEEELLAVLAGTWTEGQADEYAAMPDAFRESLLRGHDGDHEAAADTIADILSGDNLPVESCYAYLELGKEQIGAERFEDARHSLETFVDRAEDILEARELVMGALTLLGRTLLTLELTEEADEALVRATRIAADNHVAYLNLGIFLRNRGELPRSLEALDRAVELMGQMHPDFRVIREKGFTYLAMGRKKEAEDNLFAVIEHQASQGNHDQFDPEAGIALARIYEADGRLEKAADIFRHLAAGHDSLNHFTYNLEAARLLKIKGGNDDLVQRYLIRARELMTTDEHRQIMDALDSLGANG